MELYLHSSVYLLSMHRDYFTFTQGYFFVPLKVKESRNRPGVAHRVPGGLGSQISWHSAHEGGEFVSLTHWPPLPIRKCSWYSFSLSAESTPGPWYNRKEYVTEKSRDTTRNRPRDRPTSSAAFLYHYSAECYTWMHFMSSGDNSQLK